MTTAHTTHQLETFPAELRSRRQWVLWAVEERDGKPTKVPRRVDAPARKASSTDPATWSSFDEAVAALADATRQGISGVGFVFTSDDPFAGVDLDKCMGPDGHLVPAAQLIVDQLSSYTERSPSGEGLHIIVRADLAVGRKAMQEWGGHLEMYPDGRYFTVTGDHLEGTPATVEGRQLQLEKLVPAKAKAPAAARMPAGGFDGDDLELLKLARADRNGDKFAQLYDAGDTSGHNGDASGADLALCNLLAFWTGRDGARMDRLFRGSGLMREKWDRAARAGETYGAGTIRQAIEGCAETYSPPAVVSEREAGDGDAAALWDLVDPFADPGEPPPAPDRLRGSDGTALVYRGQRVLISGEPGHGKTWGALILAAEYIREGERVAWIDADGMGRAAIVERLLALGISHAEGSRLFRMTAAEENLKAEELREVVGRYVRAGYALVVMDSWGPALAALGMSSDSQDDVNAFHRVITDPLFHAGVTFAVLDHVPKNQESRGRYSVGSGAKLRPMEVHLGFRARGGSELTREADGTWLVTIHKDRHGHLGQGSTYEVSVSHNDGCRLAWDIRKEGKAHEGDPDWRPTVLMERVSRHLETVGPCSGNNVKTNVTGKARHLITGLGFLVHGRYVTTTPGTRGATLYAHAHPYRDGDPDTYGAEPDSF